MNNKELLTAISKAGNTTVQPPSFEDVSSVPSVRRQLQWAWREGLAHGIRLVEESLWEGREQYDDVRNLSS